LFIGEAPGFWEDTDGFPFVGPAGQKLDELLEDARIEYRLDNIFNSKPLTVAITNIVCCLPPPENKEAIRTPKDEEAQACSERLHEFVKIAQPKVIVHVGEISATQGAFDVPMFQMIHPSALLQTPKHIYTVKHRQAVALLVKAMERCRV
jgi:uracil-DNA glycosylase family 4